jgi:DNA-binding GntR family transcriptional regulator
MAENIKDTATDIYKTLRREILDLTIVPGQSVSEPALCERFNASRTPVRDAMKRLSTAGLITVVPYKGAYATLLNLDEIKQYVYMRNVLEYAVIVEFMNSVTPEELENLRYRLRLQKVMLSEHAKNKSSNAEFIEKFYSADSTFHKIWFISCKKELLWKVIKTSQVQYRRYRTLDMVSMTTFESIVDEHEKIFEFIKNKEKESLKKLLENHLCGGISRLAHRITSEFADYFINCE